MPDVPECEDVFRFGILSVMSMVVFPFRSEDPAVAETNLEMAAAHPRISCVVAVGAKENDLFTHLSRRAARLSSLAEVDVILQDRIGDRRPGKGDGMNTGLRRFLDSDLDRVHFYDADITNFDHSWIDGAERVADAGFDIVRHYFARASTDAMITWMVTRPLFAIGHPDSGLWRIRQPLGGEMLLTRPVVEKLVADDFVASRSDWGIDTVICYATTATGQPIYEHYLSDGKQHALYGSLAELRQMLVECFEAALGVAALPAPPPFDHHLAPEAPAPPAIAHRVAYDVESTLPLLTGSWTDGEREAAREFPAHLAGPFLANSAGRLTFAFLDAGNWYDALVALAERYRPEPGWRDLLFRLWVARVLAYTTSDALGGHGRAMEILEATVAGYARRAAAAARAVNPGF